MAGQQIAQLGLADENDAQQLMTVCFQIRQQPQLLEHVAREILCLIHDEHRAPVGGMRLEQVSVETISQRLEAGHRVTAVDHAELIADAGHELTHFELWIPAECDIQIRQFAIDHGPDEGGLSGTDLADKRDETAVFARAIQQMRQRFTVAFAEIQKRRVRRHCKRVVFESEITQIHRFRWRRYSALVYAPRLRRQTRLSPKSKSLGRTGTSGTFGYIALPY